MLVGHNGAGKTTLLSCITQAIPLSRQDMNQASYTVLQVGQQADIPAFIRGECADLAEKKRSLWAFICYHWPVQIAGVTKKQITKSESLPGKNGKVDKSEIEKDVFYYLRKLGFKPELDNLDEQVHAFLHKPSGQGLSGGEVKKLFTATFLAIAKHAQVDVLILDEITAGMDVGSLLAFQKMMEDFHKKNRDIILFEVSHRTDSSCHGLNQKGKAIWVVSNEKGSHPSIKVFEDYTKFSQWTESEDVQKKYVDIHRIKDEQYGAEWREYCFKNPISTGRKYG